MSTGTDEHPGRGRALPASEGLRVRWVALALLLFWMPGMSGCPWSGREAGGGGDADGEFPGASVDGQAVISLGECCQKDADCGKGFVCIGAADTTPGTCVPAPSGNYCFVDDDCGGGQVCAGAAVCGCEEHCMVPVSMGLCMAVGSGCCAKETDCDGGDQCVAGKCVQVPDTPECWTDETCAQDEMCAGTTVCPCGYECAQPDQAGVCVPEPPGCCNSDSDCEPGRICVKAVAHLAGLCMPSPGAGECYSVQDCPGGASCQGAKVCPCGYDCGLQHPGKCDECCKLDSDCPSGFECVVGNCENPVIPPRCWSAADCPDYNCADPDSASKCTWMGICAGVVLCPCGSACLSSSEPGWCVPQSPQCCKSAADCPKPLDCVLGNCVVSPSGGACWSSADCPPGVSCVGAKLEPCGTGSPGLDQKLGWCGGVSPCCFEDGDCPEDLVCAGEQSAPSAMGVCREATVPSYTCWSDSECGPGLKCLDALACACGLTCPDESPGICEKPTGVKCCSVSSDCAADHACIGNAAGEKWLGRCVPEPVQGACWNEADCPQGYCLGQKTCGCKEECAPKTGKCKQGQQCCESDEECPVDSRCVSDVCKPLLPYGACWDEADCGDQCLGAFVCPCGQTCEAPDATGLCGIVQQKCCYNSGQCANEGGEGGLCLFAPGQPGPGRCYESVEYPECWIDSDCQPGAVCWGITVCGCGQDKCNPAVGLCLSFGICCSVATDCPYGMDCVPTPANPWGSGVCKVPPKKGQCWSGADCQVGQECQGAALCPCNSVCASPDLPGSCNGG